MKRVWMSVLMVLASATSAQGQSEAATAPVFRVSGAFIGLSVGDMEASTKWYREKLGLTVIMQAPRTDATKSAATVLQGGGLTVELVKHDEAVPLGNFLPDSKGALYVHGIFKAGIVVDDFDATIAALRARGVNIPIGPFPKRADQPANAIMRDNAGNYIQIFGK
jgi:catechol 2,3-dioxygenase-like lactoylglutathione lyase family enzyme